MNQYKETVITKNKENSKEKVEKVFSKIYNYILKKLQSEKIIKNSLMVEQARFVSYLSDSNAIDGDEESINSEDQSIGIVQLYSDLFQTEFKAFILNSNINYVSNETVLVGYWQSIENLFILGPIQKKGVITSATN